MILESLLELVETLKARIDEHDDQLRKSEWLTRYALVDPLLRELGWNTEDPSLVMPEYQSGHGRADYALLGDGKPMMMVEAKKLGTQLRDSVLNQGINYCLMEGTNYFSVTDGQRWEVYETHKPVPIDQKRVVQFDLKHMSAAEACLKALALWRPTVQSGHVAPGYESVVGSTEGLSEPSDTSGSPPPPEDEGHEWLSITEISVKKGVKPIELRFPDGSRTHLKNWDSIAVETVRWLTDNNELDASHCPILSKDSHHCVHSEPVRKDGSSFANYEEVNGLYVEKVGFAHATISRTLSIIEYVGPDPAQFSVRFS